MAWSTSCTACLARIDLSFRECSSCEAAEAAVRFLRSYLPGLCTFALFCFVLSVSLPSLGLPAAFAAALVVQLVIQGILFWSVA